MPELHPSDERLTDLALSDLDSRDQDALTAHLALCEACDVRYSRDRGQRGRVLAAAPSMAPPPGFTSGVLAALGLDPVREATPGAQHGLRAASDATGQGWRAGLRVASEPTAQGPAPTAPASPAATRGSSSPRPATRRPSAGLTSWPLLRRCWRCWWARPGQRSCCGRPLRPRGEPGGRPVGDSEGERRRIGAGGPLRGCTRAGGERGGRAGGDVRLSGGAGRRDATGRWARGPFRPTVTAAWVVDLPDGRATRMDLVAPSGRVWASAEL